MPRRFRVQRSGPVQIQAGMNGPALVRKSVPGKKNHYAYIKMNMARSVIYIQIMVYRDTFQ